MNSYRQILALSICLTLLLANISKLAANALPLVVEIEPNNEPHLGLPFSAPSLLSGDLREANDQDAYRWRISDADAQKTWDLTLTGMPEALTGVSLFRITENEAGDAVTSKETLLTFGIRDGSRPVALRNLLLPAGELVLGVFGAGQSSTGFSPPGANLSSLTDELDPDPNADDESSLIPAYRLAIEEGDAVGVSKVASHATQSEAISLRHNTFYSEVQTGESWFQIEVPDSESLKRYTIDAGIDLSRSLTIEMIDEQGNQISSSTSNKYGQLALRNLALEPGNYFLKTIDVSNSSSEKLAAVRYLRWHEAGEVIEGEEREPNKSWAHANQMGFAQPIQASMDERGDQDFFRFPISETQSDGTWQLKLESSELQKVTLCLLNLDGTSRQCRNGTPPITLDGLLLNEGSHGVKVERSTEAGAYTLDLVSEGAFKPDTEIEPNDEATDASLFGKRRLLKGTLNAQDTDNFLLFTTEEPQLWRLQAIGSGLYDLSYWPQSGEAEQTVYAGSGSRNLRLDNLFLLPGQHRFSLTAKQDTSYVLRALPLGPPSPYMEREPNDKRNTSHSLPLNQKAVGLLTETTDIDYYRLHLAAEQPVRLSLRPAPDASYQLYLYQDGGQIKKFILPVGSPLQEILWLDPGDYYMRVSSEETSDAEYEVQVDQLSQPSLISDKEPNDDANTASPWPDNWHFQGRLNVSQAGADWYRLPQQETAQTFILPESDAARMQFIDANRNRIADAQTNEEGITTITLPPVAESYLYLSGKGEYDFRLQSDTASVAPDPSALSVQLTLTLPDTPFAAYSDWQQNLKGTLTLQNNSQNLIEALLDVNTTDDRWQASLQESTTSVEAGAQVEIPLSLFAEPDVWPDNPIFIQVSARDKNNGIAQTELAVQAVRHAKPVNPSIYSPVPENLRSHINVAADNLGAEWQGDAATFSDLNDGILVLGRYFSSKRDGKTGPALDVPVIQLAGDAPILVTGFSLHPFGLQDGQPAQRNAREFEIDLSIDGENFTTVLSAELSAQTREQFFSLPTPQPARFARLRLLGSKDPYSIALGEWKVLADRTTLAESTGYNLADPVYGGHVVAMSPPVPNYGYSEPLLKPDDESATLTMTKGYDAAWVVGFHHNRAARISNIIWRNPEQGTLFKSTEVLVSTDSPLGPWQSLGQWTLDGSGEQTYDLPQPVWARFVKFDPADPEDRTRMTLPDQIQIIEEPNDNGSILGEWGYDNFRGPFELANPPLLAADAEAAPEHSQRGNARELKANVPENGVVKLGDYENWYTVTIPEGQNTLTLTLKSSSTVRAQATLFDAQDTAIDFQTVESLPNELVIEATVAPGNHLLKISEPPRSVVLTWDTSPSTLQVQPIIKQAVVNYVQDVKPDLDEAHMLPFGGDFLSRQWLDQPYLLQNALNDYNGAGNSSAAETALVRSSKVLKERPGQRVIVLITDAGTSSDSALWATLEETRPRIIALGVSSGSGFGSQAKRERDLMQDWAMVANGYYEYVENVGSMERAFDRASSKIRQPAPYQLVMNTRLEANPEPGFLQVISAPKNTQPDIQLPSRTIEIVLDASGSMWQKMDGKHRYQIAQETLTELVETQLPGSVQFALRAFGHEEAGSCRTDLVMPPAKLDRAAIKIKLTEIVPKSLAKTPIGASLAAVAQDLAGVEGEKVVLLITDGEETCDGNVEAAIEKLTEQGIDAVVNIIGFAVDDPALSATFERWAKEGGGVYRSASSPESLNEAVQSLAAKSYKVFDQSGEIVAQGNVNDESVSLTAGSYRLQVGSGDLIKFVIKPEEITVKSAN